MVWLALSALWLINCQGGPFNSAPIWGASCRTTFLLRRDSPNFAPFAAIIVVWGAPMKIVIVFGLLTLCPAVQAYAQDDATRWLTFNTGTWSSYGKVLHQIDRTTIKQEGPYKTFRARVWVIREHQPMAINYHEQLFFLWRKYAVDCAQRRFGSQFIESNDPRAYNTSLQAMRWVKLDTVPAAARTVCGEK